MPRSVTRNNYTILADTMNTKEQARILKVLSVEARLKILNLLKKHPMCVNAIACRLGISQGAVSQHLRIMRDAGLLVDEKQGYYVHYRLDEHTFGKWKAEVDEVLSRENEVEPKDEGECERC